MKLTSKNIVDTQKIAQILVEKILNTKANKSAVVVALEGELGAGKTVLVKGIAKALGIKAHITSPTFVLLKQYKIPSKAKSLKSKVTRITGLRPSTLDLRQLIHIDAYRLKDYQALVAIGVKEIISDPKNIVLIEWSERVKPILPSKKIKVHIDHVGESQRRIEIKWPMPNS